MLLLWPSSLHAQIAAVAPITSVSIGDPNDKKTWAVAFAPEAVDEQKAAAAKAIEDFEVPVGA